MIGWFVASGLRRLATFIRGASRVSLAVVLSLLIVPPVAAGVAAVTLLRAPLPGDLPEQRPMLTAIPSVVVDRDGNEIGLFRGFDRSIEIDRSDLPQVMIDAIVAIEDRRFWEHRGVDFEGVLRAARTNLELGEIAQGGSTITQQYIKNAYLSGERTFERKFREALLATELEQQLSKDEILFRYLESSYFGSGAYGIGAAAEVYFAKPVSELDLSEAATLAGIVQSPTRLSPRVDIEAAEDRRRLVLQTMLDEAMITVEQFDRHVVRQLWLAEPGVIAPGAVTVIAPLPPKGATDHPFFVDWIEQEMLDTLGPDLVYRGGLTIETTIDPDLQAAAEAAVAARLVNTDYPVDMSLVSLDPRTGEVLVMVGGRDYDFSQVNLAVGGSTGFQPGSSFKPIVMAQAFQQGIGPDTVYPAPATWVVPGCTGSQCTISNYDNQARGDITLRDAMRASVNTVFAELITDVSIGNTVLLARDLGLERIDPDGVYGASLALGAAETSPLEMASAYGTFANRGVRQTPIGVLRVLDAEGNVLVDNRSMAADRVLNSIVADNVTNVLLDVVADGTGGRAEVAGHDIAGKTGTAQAYRAAWFVGYTPSLSTAVWMGHADGLASLRNVNGVGNVTGGSHPAIAFSQFMTAALAGTEPEFFPEPAPLEDIASSDEVSPVRQEATVVGGRRWPTAIRQDCSGVSCDYSAVPAPALTPPAPTTTAPPTTPSTAPPSTEPTTPSTVGTSS